jgi:hypothetical protein
MQNFNRGSARSRTGALFVALIALIVAAIGAATMSVQAQTSPTSAAPQAVAESDATLSGRYLGSQDDVRFGMAVQQDGTIVRGVIVQPLPQTAETDFIDADTAALAGDRLFGIVNGDQIFLIRFSDPAQFWFGEISRSSTAVEMKGRWISSPGEGTWHARSARGSQLAVTARVAPHEIEAGETARMQYGVRIDNEGERTARSTQLSLRGLPDFYRIDSIEIVRGRITDDLESVVGTDLAPAALASGLSLPLGDLEPDTSILVRVVGAAAPQDKHEGDHTTRVTASADNARKVANRVALTVGNGTLRLSNAFSPSVVSTSTDAGRPDVRIDARGDVREIDVLRPSIVVGRDGLVTYTITVSAQPFKEVVVTDASIFGILCGAQVNVHGATARGTLATGLVLSPLARGRPGPQQRRCHRDDHGDRGRGPPLARPPHRLGEGRCRRPSRAIDGHSHGHR